MGNSQSSNDESKSPSASAGGALQSLHRRDKERESAQARLGPNGSQSVPRKPQSHVTNARTHAHAPPPTQLVPSSTTAASTSTSNTYAQANVISASPASSHSRARSITTGTPKAPAADDSASRSPMGNAESRHRPPSRSSTLPPPVTEKPAPSPTSRPVDVPQPPRHDGLDDLEPTMTSPLYGLPASDFSRPPRLPLPIDRDPDPTSPIITPQDDITPTEHADEDDLVHRRASMLSSTTLDDDEVADIETFSLETDPFAQKFPTRIDLVWDARTVFVTGTFAKWEKKFRMHRTQDKNGTTMFTLTALLPAGTHHIRFLVDGEMVVTTQHMQTVDFTNSLVNYIEVRATTPPTETMQPAAPAEPIDISGADDTTAVEDGAAKPLDIRTNEQVPETQDKLSSTLQQTVDPAFQDPSLQDQTSKPIDIPAPDSRYHQQQPHLQESQPEKPKRQVLPRPKYTSEIPPLLLHLDLYNSPDDERFQRASKAQGNLPAPPSLPMFMSKSILNATTPHKDDASVLTMPNHTVLNHLATSSIKSGVLATSGTTRYKKKFLTTIMYKPTSDDG